MYEYASVIARSGRSTYRIAIEQETDQFWKWWNRLEGLGCTYESGAVRGMRLYAVDVPPDADIYSVYDILKQGQEQKVWFFEEGHVGHALKNEGTPNPN